MQRFFFTAFALIAVGLAFGYAGYLDERARLEAELLDARHERDVWEAYQRGREAGNAEMVDSAQAAWEAAQAEANRCRERSL